MFKINAKSIVLIFQIHNRGGTVVIANKTIKISVELVQEFVMKKIKFNKTDNVFVFQVS